MLEAFKLFEKVRACASQTILAEAPCFILRHVRRGKLRIMRLRFWSLLTAVCVRRTFMCQTHVCKDLAMDDAIE